MEKRWRLFFIIILILLAVVVGFLLSAQSTRVPPEPSPLPTPDYPKAISPTGTVMLESKASHNILYSPREGKYNIIVYGSPFAEARPKAEDALLKQLGVSQEQACLLNISVTTPHFMNPNESFRIYKLSFCPSSNLTP